MKSAAVPVFEDKYDATVTLDIGSSADRYSKIRAQASNPQVTVHINTDDILIDAARRGLLGEIDSANIPNIEDVHDWGVPKSLEGHGAAYSVLAYGMNVVEDQLALPVASWKDMWRDEFKENLAIAAPAHANMPQLLIIAAELHGGSQDDIEPGLEALAKLRPVHQSFFWTDYAAMVASGEVIIATEFDYYTLFMRDQGHDVEWISPQEKAIGVVQFAALVKDSPHPDLGEGFINTLLDPEVQAGLADEAYLPPSNKLVHLDPPLSEQVTYGPRLERVRFFDADFIADNKAQWLERINTEVVPAWGN